MNGRRIIVQLFLLCAIALPSAALGLPADQVRHFAIRVDPADPTSAVQYVLTLTLSAAEQDGDWIGWEIENYQITERVTLGPDHVWDVDFPDVGTTDGLWWIEHADPDNPIPPEFTEPAPVADTAIANDPADPDLAFVIVGVEYTAPPEGPPYEVTAALDFEFRTSTDPNDPPDDSGDDEPVDGADVPNPGPAAQ